MEKSWNSHQVSRLHVGLYLKGSLDTLTTSLLQLQDMMIMMNVSNQVVRRKTSSTNLTGRLDTLTTSVLGK